MNRQQFPVPTWTFGALVLAAALTATCINEASTAPGQRESGTFACGPSLTCRTESQYCSIQTGGPAGVPPGYQCVDLPAACRSNPSCSCLPEQIGCTCREADGRLTVTCSAP